MQKPINVHLSIRFSNSLCKVQIFKKYLAIWKTSRKTFKMALKKGFENTENYKPSQRAIPSISSYKRGGAHGGVVHPPTRFGHNLYAKNVIDVF